MTTTLDIQNPTDEFDIAHQAFILGEVTANCTKPRQDGSRSWRLRMRRQGPELVSTKDGPSTRRDAVRLSTRLALDIASSNAHATENRPDQAFVDGLLQGVAEWLKERGGLLLDGDEVAAIHELITEQFLKGLPKGSLVEQVRELAQVLSGERAKASKFLDDLRAAMQPPEGMDSPTRMLAEVKRLRCNDMTPAPFAKGAAEHIFAAKVARCMGLDAGQVLARLQGSDANFAAMVAERLREGLDQRYLASDGDKHSLMPGDKEAILTALAKPDCTDADILREIVHADAHAEDLLATGREAWNTMQHLINPFETLVEYGKLQAQTDRHTVAVFRATDVQAALNGVDISDSPCDLAKQVANLKAERDALAKENAALKVRLGAATTPDPFEVEDAQGTFEASRATAQRDALLDLIRREAGNTMLRRLAFWLGDVEPAEDEYVVGKVEALLELYSQPPSATRDLRIRREMGTLLEEAGQALSRTQAASYARHVKALDESEGAA